MLLVGPVREVEPEHPNAGINELAQDLWLPGRRADRCHDLGPNGRQGVSTRAGHDLLPSGDYRPSPLPAT